MNWLAIGSAVFLIAMIIFIFPNMKKAVANSPKGNMSDWMGFIIPLAAVIGFVVLLVKMV
ncbi:hypothetical protein MNBD_GAMMA10-329 [hydrothermal vent metagenome]|uniref:Uncharacterized protein n=1 Tax=hydrothermal vent metagenome TaxID=652676 RepID=A0A3B0Y3C3_9ZZZZ